MQSLRRFVLLLKYDEYWAIPCLGIDLYRGGLYCRLLSGTKEDFVKIGATMNIKAHRQVVGLRNRSLVLFVFGFFGGMALGQMLLGILVGGLSAGYMERRGRRTDGKRMVIPDYAHSPRLADIVLTGECKIIEDLLAVAARENRVVLIERPERGIEGVLFSRAMKALCAMQQLECHASYASGINVGLGDQSRCLIVVEDYAGGFERSIQHLVARGWKADGQPAVHRSFWGTRYVQRMVPTEQRDALH
jgi:hypothetical protein